MTFQGFSPESFEQLIRALSIIILGPGVSIFGNGPDGGREATFSGKVNYPHTPFSPWDGYGVIQAKFKEKTESTQIDQNWAESQLKNELTLWAENNNRQPKPDYFIFCTNVELSSAKNGGKERLNKLLQSHKRKHGLKDFAIWDANQLSSYIDINSEIRKRFHAFLTTGDLLHELILKLNNKANKELILTGLHPLC